MAQVRKSWGALGLAGDIRPEPERLHSRQRPPPKRPVSPVLVTADKPLEEWLRPIPGKPGTHSPGTSVPRIFPTSHANSTNAATPASASV